MGGRGSSIGGSKKTESNKKTGGQNLLSMNTKFSSKQVDAMSRSQLETAARAIFIKQNMRMGLSASEADYRARSLMSGNTNAQLRKYIKRYG